MICFRCGEKNPDSYSFCGMCGSSLQSAKPVPVAEGTQAEAGGEARGGSTPEKRSENFRFSRAEQIAKSAPSARVEPRTESISGPSLLGLNESSLESLRDKAFSSANEIYYEPLGRRPAWGRIFVLLIVIGTAAGAAWWRYGSNGPLRARIERALQDSGIKQTPSAPAITPAVGNSSAASSSAANLSDKKDVPAQPPAGDNASAAGSAPAPGTPEASTLADNKADTKKAAEPVKKSDSSGEEESAKAETAKPVGKQQPASEKPAVKPAKDVLARNTVSPEKAVKPAPAAAVSDGDVLFRKGEAYLYGRGVPESCDQAIKYLKSASDKSHAKARSTFGTMYATGHCVPRDLPTSYRWFALALRVDPNNQILEKDLSAVWNQMTPPERQLATKSQ